ncbi:hypothetical protein [Bacillus bingmayongensis]|uniref:hypothetical protein n=1 Tax=Bacillus bingmayongensis TaxID=1150157 RepID=UPI001C8E2303|nr:hypothetical protein [Bacillus bingmayongensis]MBY0595114.1 hypothetical protein [Bacillus bingmayongensis]
MKMFLVTLIISLTLLGCSAQKKTNEALSFEFVSWENEVYVVSDGEKVEKVEVGQRIGEVTEFIDQEGRNYQGTASNVFKEGTKLYKIKDIGTNKSIAVQKDDGTFIKGTLSDEWLKENLGSIANQEISIPIGE